MALSASRIAALAVMSMAVLLHAYEQVANSTPPSIGWFLWSMLPYGVCLLFLLRSRSGVPGATGAGVALVWDAITHYEVFVHPTSSTAALALIFVPLWSALLFSPIAMLIAWLVVRKRPRVSAASAK